MPSALGIHYTLHNTDPGSRTPVVLIHGAGGNQLSWPAGMRRLPGFRVYAIDLPGHGKSGGNGLDSIPGYADMLTSWLEVMELRSVVLAGHSMGGAIALWMALEHPGCVSSLILIGSGARMRVHPELLESSRHPVTFQSAVSQVTEWSYGAEVPQNLVRLARQRLAEIPAQVLYGDFLACDGFDVLNRLEQVSQPALVICGEADRMTPLKHARFLVNGLPTARLLVIQGAGHMVMLEKPEEVASAVVGFLNDQAGSSPGAQEELD